MLDSKSKIIKISGYFLIGFFLLIIIISFGMPDFMSRIGMDQNTVAVINGQKIHRLEYIRFKDNMSRRYKDSQKKDINQFILERMIQSKLEVQLADKLGIQVSDIKIKRTIKSIPNFQDKSGTFNGDYFKQVLKYSHYNLADYYKLVNESLMSSELRQMVGIGSSVSPEEVNNEFTIENSQIQIKYCFLSNKDIKKRHKNKITVKENEIDEELRKNKTEIKDPKTDRKRIKDILEKRKYEKLKNDLIKKINTLADEGSSFLQTAAKLKGKTSVSNIFKIGGQIKEKNNKGRILYSIYRSKIFMNECLAIKNKMTSSVIIGFDGLYIFTPIKKIINIKKPSTPEFNAIVNKLMNEKSSAFYIMMMTAFRDKSKITKNLKFN